MKHSGISHTHYYQIALNHLGFKALEDAQNSIWPVSLYYLNKAKKYFKTCIESDKNQLPTMANFSEARMGLVLAHLQRKEYEEADKELDKLNGLFDSPVKKNPEIVIFTALCYVDMLNRRYQPDEQKIRAIAEHYHALIPEGNTGVDRKLHDLLFGPTISKYDLDNISYELEKEKLSRATFELRGSLNSVLINEKFSLLYMPIINELERLKEIAD